MYNSKMPKTSERRCALESDQGVTELGAYLTIPDIMLIQDINQSKFQKQILMKDESTKKYSEVYSLH